VIYRPGERRNLGFQEEVLESFRWLEDYQYRLFEESSTFVRYEGPLGYVNVYHGRSSYEVGVEIAPPGEGVSSYSMSALIQLTDTEESKSYRNPIATSIQTVRNLVAAQAQRLKLYGRRIFAGNSQVWKELEHQRRQRAEDYAMEVLLSQVRPEAERSFRNHDSKRVVRLLSAVELRLTPAERKKLDYARRQVSRNT
jgi:hypothetical protein